MEMGIKREKQEMNIDRVSDPNLVDVKKRVEANQYTEFKAHVMGVSSLEVTFEGQDLVLYTGCDNGEVGAWDLSPKSSSCRWKLFGHRGPVVSIQSDSEKMVTGSLDGTVRVWNDPKISGHPIYAISGFTAFIGSVQFEEGRLICDGTNNV
eukprot:CAMPEP_0196572874 /NCGR_PEP_ID=MMETSP1081-20130531/2856_1 /TAXON_ID=36882 /ORGANISM="Pyramimonas amylifera, Strain CCMP720" /LENGTH=150 /DNA_ID=CAMNT_0041890355 /DNA_START=69 /DNA_END=518 /DNA_ORIENTATION=-